MRGIVLTEPGSSVLTDLPDPQPGADEVLVQGEVCGLCGTDMHIYDGALASAPYTLTPGHELAGVVVDTGADVPWLASDTVTRSTDLSSVPTIATFCTGNSWSER